MELMQGNMLSGVNTSGETSSTWHGKIDVREGQGSNGLKEIKPGRPTCHRVGFKDGLTENIVQV